MTFYVAQNMHVLISIQGIFMSHGRLADYDEGIAFGMDGDFSTYFHFILVINAHYYILKHIC